MPTPPGARSSAEPEIPGAAAFRPLSRLGSGSSNGRLVEFLAMSDVVEDVIEMARAWASADPDPATADELTRLVNEGAVDALQERMAPPLAFGTAGLRAKVGAGSARMNRAVVRRTTRGLADFLASRGGGVRNLPVVVGFDARPESRRFALDVVGVLAAAHVPVRYFDEPVPTPLVAYAARVYAAQAAVVITASHNPRGDNGYKLYLEDAVQLVSPRDREIERAIARVGPANLVPFVDVEAGVNEFPDRVDVAKLELEKMLSRYVAEITAELGAPLGPSPLRIAYTPLHGVGLRFTRPALESSGFGDLRAVPEQAEPDGAFPTTPFPNPEEPGALDLALAFAESENADILLAHDPDADRLAAAVPTPSGRFRRLSGNELGALLTEARLEELHPGAKGLVLSSVVTTPLIGDIARAHGVRFETTLTGFKWLWTVARQLERDEGLRFVSACEEALGYSMTRAVRDKDGISAALLTLRLAERCRRQNESLLDLLHRMERRYGVWASAQRSVTLPGLEGRARIARAVESAANEPPGELSGLRVVAVRDYREGSRTRPVNLPPAQLVELTLEHGRVLVRPSGTEPKLKLYVDLHAEVPDNQAAGTIEDEVGSRARDVAAALLEKLGLL
jgi:phosphomannomutase